MFLILLSQLGIPLLLFILSSNLKFTPTSEAKQGQEAKCKSQVQAGRRKKSKFSPISLVSRKNQQKTKSPNQKSNNQKKNKIRSKKKEFEMADNNQEDLKINAVSSVPAPTEIPVRRTTSISRLTSNDAEVSSVDSGGRMISLAAKPPQQVKTESPQTTVSLSPDHQEMTTSLSASDHHHHDNMVAAITTTSTANESSPIPISVAESTSMMRDSSATVLINNKSKVPVTSVKSIFQESSSSNTLSSQPSMAGGVAGAPPKHPSANVSTASIKPDDSSTTSGSRIRLGICAMDKKA